MKVDEYMKNETTIDLGAFINELSTYKQYIYTVIIRSNADKAKVKLKSTSIYENFYMKKYKSNEYLVFSSRADDDCKMILCGNIDKVNKSCESETENRYKIYFNDLNDCVVLVCRK